MFFKDHRLHFLTKAAGTAAIVMSAATSHAATLFESTLPHVLINGNNYTVHFQQFGGGSTQNSFNAHFGTSTTITSFTWVTAEQAYTAIESINLAMQSDPVDVSPAPDGILNGFIVPFSADSVQFRYRTGLNGSNIPSANPSDSFVAARTSPVALSFAFFELTPVPVPPALWLFGSALAGLTVLKRKRT